MKQMGCIWRSSKSRLVSQITKAKNNAERMKLRPKNIPTAEWRKFVKQKTSEEFKVFTITNSISLALSVYYRLSF